MLTEIYTIEGGQKDVLLRRTNIKKNIVVSAPKNSNRLGNTV